MEKDKTNSMPVFIRLTTADVNKLINEDLERALKGKKVILVLDGYDELSPDTKINLYVPGFPSKAFYTACSKVLEFDGKFPDVSVLISVTSACRYKCPHCYQKFDKGRDMDIEVLVETVKKLQDKGVAFFNIEGGDPFLVFDKLMKVCDAIDERSEIIYCPLPPSFLISSMTLFALVMLRPIITTEALFLAIFSAVALPKPLVAPMTTTVLSFI